MDAQVIRRVQLSHVTTHNYPAVRLSVALAGLTAPVAMREQIAWAAATGFRAVQLNAAAPGARPRDLDRSARRDLAAVLRRSELTLSGVDLWIPPAHFSDPARNDKAVGAVMDALAFASEVAALCAGRPTVSLNLPSNREGARSVVAAMAVRCQEVGARIADHTWPPDAELDPETPVGVGLDPAAVFLSGAERAPEEEILRLGPRLASVRLTDLASTGRVVPGAGRLDLLSYLVSAISAPEGQPLVLDLQGLATQHEAAADIVERCGG